MRSSKTYTAFKTFNGIVFIGLGALIIFQLATRVGFRFEALSGFVLGAALIGLGVFRAVSFARSRQ